MTYTFQGIYARLSDLPSTALEFVLWVAGAFHKEFEVESKRLRYERIIETNELTCERLESKIAAMFARVDALDDAADEAEAALNALQPAA